MAKKSDLLFLIGMPGSGKSHWARTLCNEHHAHFLDTDTLIEEQENKSINEIFERYGEDHFRRIEHEIIKAIVNNTDRFSIISVGGGAPCFYDNMRWMNDHGTTVYLKASSTYLLQNLENKTAHRPLLKGDYPDLEAKIETLLLSREKYYELADHIVDVEQLSLNTFAAILKRHV